MRTGRRRHAAPPLVRRRTVQKTECSSTLPQPFSSAFVAVGCPAQALQQCTTRRAKTLIVSLCVCVGLVDVLLLRERRRRRRHCTGRSKLFTPRAPTPCHCQRRCSDAGDRTRRATAPPADSSTGIYQSRPLLSRSHRDSDGRRQHQGGDAKKKFFFRVAAWRALSLPGDELF